MGALPFDRSTRVLHQPARFEHIGDVQRIDNLAHAASHVDIQLCGFEALVLHQVLQLEKVHLGSVLCREPPAKIMKSIPALFAALGDARSLLNLAEVGPQGSFVEVPGKNMGIEASI